MSVPAEEASMTGMSLRQNMQMNPLLFSYVLTDTLSKLSLPTTDDGSVNVAF